MENKKYDILIIGYNDVNTFESGLARELKSRGHDVNIYRSFSICNQMSAYERGDYMNGNRDVSLFSYFKKFYEYGCDFIIVCQTGLSFINDIHIPVFYYHRELNQSPTCTNPTYIIMNVPEARNYLRAHHKKLWSHARNRQFVYTAADPSLFNPNREKDLKGLNYIGWWEAANTWVIDPIWNEIMTHCNDIPIWATEQKLCTTHADGNVRSCPSFNDYRDYMERSEAFLMVTGKWVYLSRRQIEAAMCKTLNVIWIQSDASEKANNRLGFYDRQNCIMFREKEDLANGAVSWTKEELKEMTEDAYALVMEKHTYKNRADQILNIFERRL